MKKQNKTKQDIETSHVRILQIDKDYIVRESKKIKGMSYYGIVSRLVQFEKDNKEIIKKLKQYEEHDNKIAIKNIEAFVKRSHKKDK